jgi:hypothetical protein
MLNKLALKVLAIGLIFLSGVAPTAIVLFHDRTVAFILQFAPASRPCEQAVPGVCEPTSQFPENAKVQTINMTSTSHRAKVTPRQIRLADELSGQGVLKPRHSLVPYLAVLGVGFVLGAIFVLLPLALLG